MLNEKLDARLAELIKQWNIAERRIKQAENARAQEVVSSAIFELRYAGRKLIDAIHLVNTKDWQNDEEAAEQIHAYIDDAVEDCIKAKHDAIDAVMSFVVKWFADQESRLGLSYVQKYYPNYLSLTAKISDIQEKIEESREDRTAKRDSIYDEIENNGYDDILGLYRQMKSSEGRVRRIVNWEKGKDIALWIFGIAGLIALAAALFPKVFVIY